MSNVLLHAKNAQRNASIVQLIARTNPEWNPASNYAMIVQRHAINVQKIVKQILQIRCNPFKHAFKHVKIVQRNVKNMIMQLVRNVLKHVGPALKNVKEFQRSSFKLAVIN